MKGRDPGLRADVAVGMLTSSRASLEVWDWVRLLTTYS
jgi:hypothetical protein